MSNQIANVGYVMVPPFCFLVVRLVGEIKIQKKKRFLFFALFCVPIGRRTSKNKKIKAFLVFGFRRPDWTDLKGSNIPNLVF